MADFYITAVKYDENHEHIVKVKTRQRVDGKVKAPSINSRQFIVELINTGKVSFWTGLQDSEGRWGKGADVTVTSTGFLTTSPNNTTRDNLGELPEF
ncbi:DUF3892 domain-containing protein [Escherichia coli]|uniref:DUF3892 domain-containing protein n=1 Tax=Enterobacteriaceae TaxID=543 RepID=UPI0003EF14C0|nr:MULTISPECIES: DUF3892 domain-containing protein [Enterobacteriaceae]EIX6927955.1 DUF3892 domain-containing protein [Salmonella enterica subsp. enterica serovar Bredeney]EGJ9766550.1 DUF3892 domain-containing protein [Escherichia coli]EGM7727376.1 DUF3892 domain-containing protein [Escherichia coli]EHX1972068.1 DUF3892 domain-containing protein [Escherichia coli]EIS2606094.1 DUF3892 domain-containing protein [Escherichia coli]